MVNIKRLVKSSVNTLLCQLTCLNLYRSLDFSWKLSLSSSLCRFSMNVSLLRKFLMTQWGKGWQSSSRSPAHREQRAAWRCRGRNHFLRVESVTGEFVVFSLRTLAVVTFVTPRLTQILLQLLVLEQRAQLGRFVTTLLFLLFCCVSHTRSSFGCHGRNFPNRDNGEFKLIHKNNSLCWRRGKGLLSQTDDVSMPQSHFSPREDWQAEKFPFIGSY